MFSTKFTKNLSKKALLLGFVLAQAIPAHCLVKMDSDSVNLALKYGMQNQNMGYYTLLGPNWMEGDNGTLLNIYSPFMLLAARAAKGGFPENPTDEDIQKARKKYQHEISHDLDPNGRLKIKFAVALYGDTPNFASEYRAWIEGIGHGKTFIIKPEQTVRQKQAHFYKDTDTDVGDSAKDAKPKEPSAMGSVVNTAGGKASKNLYDAINAYYFSFNDLETLDEYQFDLQGPDGKIQTFRIKNKEIY